MLRLYKYFGKPCRLLPGFPTAAHSVHRVNCNFGRVTTVRGDHFARTLVGRNLGPAGGTGKDSGIPSHTAQNIFGSTGYTIIRCSSTFASKPIVCSYSYRKLLNMAAKGGEYSVGSKVVLANGVAMPKIQFGVYEVNPGNECEKVVTWALEVGYRAIDSAQWYYNEASCGKAINSFLSSHPELTRQDIFFTTKLQNNVSYDDTRKNIKASIEKIGLGYIDLYLLHSPYGGKTKRAECWRAVADAVEEGEVRVGGVSNFGVRHLKELLDQLNEKDPGSKRRPQVNQIEVHPFNTNSEITRFCRENGIQIEAYAPLVRARRFNHSVIKELSAKYNCTSAQLLVRWSLQMGYVPLPKSVNKQRIEANKEVGGIVISDEDVKRLEALDEGLVTDWDPTDAP